MIHNGCGCHQVKVYPGLSVRVGLACKAYANSGLTKVVPIIIVVRDVCGCRQVKVYPGLSVCVGLACKAHAGFVLLARRFCLQGLRFRVVLYG